MTRRFFRDLNRVVLPLVKRGLAGPLPLGVGLVVTETTGRVSGKAREVPLLSLRLPGRVIVTTLRPDSQWLANLEADPAARVWFCGSPHDATASINRGPLDTATLTLA